MSQEEAEGMGPEAAIGFPPLAEVVRATGEEGMPDGGGSFAKEEGVDGSVGSAHEEIPTHSGEEAIEVVQFQEGSEEIMAPEASQFPPEVWRDATRGAAIPRHLRGDRLARWEDKAKRLKEECDHCKKCLTSRTVECDDLREEVAWSGAEIGRLKKELRRLREQCAVLDMAKRLAERDVAVQRNARENAELRVSELERDVEMLRRVGGEGRLLCETQGRCRSMVGELALLRQEAEQKESELNAVQAQLTEARSVNARLSISEGRLTEELARLKVKNRGHEDKERKEDEMRRRWPFLKAHVDFTRKVRQPRRPLAAVSRQVRRFVCRLQGLLCPPVAGRGVSMAVFGEAGRIPTMEDCSAMAEREVGGDPPRGKHF
jgi:hypothetical protein